MIRLEVIIKLGIMLGIFMLTINTSFSNDNNKYINGFEIIPKPQSIKPSGSNFSIKPSTIIVVPDNSPEIFQLGRQLSDQIRKLTEYTLEVREQSKITVDTGTITLTVKGADASLGDEGYSLNIDGNGVVISAIRPAGLFYGIQTLRQIMMSGADSWRFTRTLPGVAIQDKPVYRWRGFQLDCSRHFMSLDFVKRYIDLLAYHKMNVFHWHLTDDQGWRIEIKQYPALVEKAAWRGVGEHRHGGYYTQEEAREVIEYAKKRYITVVPEIEMPGHATAAIAAYPELSCTGETIEVQTTWGIHTNLFCAGKEQTFEFLENVLKEVCDIFPSQYIHIGGDEAKKDQWEKCPLCQKRIKEKNLKDENELQGYFTRRIDAFLQTLGRSTVGWDEILEGNPSQTAIVQSWRGMEGAIEGAKKGHQVISSPAEFVYLDFPNIDEGIHDTGWLRPTTIEKVYSFNPTPDKLTAQEASLILGGECPLWSERAPQPEVDYMVFPRLCAFSETVWSPIETKNWGDFSERMNVHYARLEALGVDYFTPTIKVGEWQSGQITDAYSILERDITKFIQKPGHYRCTVRQDEGTGNVNIQWVALLENGQEISRDTHEGLSGKRNKMHTYRFRIDSIRPDAQYTVKVNMRTEDGDSKGSFMMRWFKE